MAVDHGHIDVVKVLLERGANTEIKNLKGWTVMHKAAAKGWEEIIRLLAQKGADVNAEVKAGQ